MHSAVLLMVRVDLYFGNWVVRRSLRGFDSSVSFMIWNSDSEQGCVVDDGSL
jgi:hypothetical protein